MEYEQILKELEQAVETDPNIEIVVLMETHGHTYAIDNCETIYHECDCCKPPKRELKRAIHHWHKFLFGKEYH